MLQYHSGDFTFWKFLKDVPPRDLERVLGFHPGRLAEGFTVVVLSKSELITEHDFELGASTRWSRSVIHDRSGRPRTIEGLLHERGQNVHELRRKVCKFLVSDLNYIPAKVIPNILHSPNMKYPDAEALAPRIRSGVPTFRLIVKKRLDTVRAYGKYYIPLSI